MRSRNSRLAGALALFVALGTAPALHAQERRFDVAAQPAASGVRQFARQAGIQVIVAGDEAAPRSTNRVEGSLGVRAALDVLLEGTGLVLQSFTDGVAVLSPATAPVPSPGAAAAATPPETLRVERVVVTGSRVARPDLVNPMPVSVVDVGPALRFGGNSLYGVLAQDPAMGAGSSLSSHPGGWDAGIAAVNLRNLGTNRSLTLVDGKRRVSSSARSSAVDIGAIPIGLIERVDLVTGGAAAVYGADAVTGAVNIITRRDIDQTTLSASRGASGRGDADEFMASFSTGTASADGRSRASFGATYARTAPLHMQDRFDWRDQPYYLPNLADTGVDDGIHDRSLLWHYRQHYYAYEPTFWLAGEQQRYMLEEDGSVRPMVHDRYWDRVPMNKALGDGGDGRNLADADPLRARQTLLSAMGRVDHEISARLRYEGWFNVADADYRGTGPLWREDDRTTFMGVGGARAYLDNPFLPASIRALMVDNGLDALHIDRTYGNLPARREQHARRSFTIGSAVAGPATAYTGWSAFAQYGRVDDHAVQGNVPVRSHWLAARDAVADPVTGRPVCRDAAARAAGCVPLDIFSTAPLGRESLHYLLGTRDEHRTTTQLLLGAELGGSALRMPAGAVDFALGVEYRRETLENTDDPMALSGELVYGGGPGKRSELDVGSSVAEAFVEAVVPLAASAPLARRLDLELAYRHSDYSTVGPTNAWKAGAIWEPVHGLALRGVRSRSVRTPNFGELYEPQYTNTTVGSIDDPCEAGAYAATATRAAKCLALGVVEPLPDIKTGPHVTTGGNPDLAPEVSDSLTLGLVWQPAFLPGFDLTLDYWDIDIAGVITTFGYSRLLYLCVDQPTIDNPYCALSARNQDPDHPTLPPGAPLWVQSRTMNASRMHARGVDVGATWQAGLGPGRLRVRFSGTWLIESITETTPGIAAADVVNGGGWRDPRLRAGIDAGYRISKLDLGWRVRHHGHARFDPNTTSAEAYEVDRVPSRTWHDLSIGYRTASGHVFGASVANVFDAMPPYLPGIYADNTVYDVVGRRYTLHWSYRF